MVTLKNPIGTAFEKEIRKSLIHFAQHNPNFWFKKLVDTNAIRGFGGAFNRYYEDVNFAFKQMIIPTVPADYMAIYNGKPYFLECKASKSKTSYNLVDYIKPHQADSARAISQAGGTYLFLIHKRAQKRKEQRLFVMDGVFIAETIDLLTEAHKRSRKWQWMEDNALLILSKGKADNPWDLSLIFYDWKRIDGG